MAPAKYPFRSGRYIKQTNDYNAFIPSPLPPDPPINYSNELLTLLSQADLALGRLDAATEFLPNPSLFVRMYVRKEAVLSSQIEGTQASMVDLLDSEVRRPTQGRDVSEVSNYVKAMNLGLNQLETLPLSNRLIKQIHAELLENVRGSEREPGEFRRSQNWIGQAGPGGIRDATFVPPPAHEVDNAMGELEKFFHDDRPMPVLVRVALLHVQFETIHPFLDGNGRMGRLLITFYLCWKSVLRRPMLYLSYYLKQNRESYYQLLQNVRDNGDFERWIAFFLRGVLITSDEGVETARRIQFLREQHRELIASSFQGSSVGLRLLDFLFQNPVVNAGMAAEAIERTYPVANKLLADFEKIGLLKEVTGQARNRVFRYQPYIDIFGENAP